MGSRDSQALDVNEVLSVGRRRGSDGSLALLDLDTEGLHQLAIGPTASQGMMTRCQPKR